MQGNTAHANALRFTNVFVTDDEAHLLRRSIELGEALTSLEDDPRLKGTPWSHRLFMVEESDRSGDEGPMPRHLEALLFGCLQGRDERGAAMVRSVLDRVESRLDEQLVEGRCAA